MWKTTCSLVPLPENALDAVFDRMRATVAADLDFHLEDNVAGFLGVLMTPSENGTIEISQTGLTDHMIAAMG
mgnify:CR=1 FL=1|jgi:hypothetical protein